MPPQDDIESFVNPEGYWSYEGTYVVELTETADKEAPGKSVEIDGNIVTVRNGWVGQSMGFLEMSDANKHSLPWSGYENIKLIRKESGDLIWVNEDLK